MTKATMNDPRFEAGETLAIKNVPVRWAHLINPDTMYQPQWSVEMLLNAADAKQMKALGFNVKDSEDGPFLKAKSVVTTRGGKVNRKPVLVGPDPAVPFEEEVGNGSVCNVLVYAKYVTVSGKKYLACYLNGVQVIEHVAYTASAAGFTDESAKTNDIPF